LIRRVGCDERTWFFVRGWVARIYVYVDNGTRALTMYFGDNISLEGFRITGFLPIVQTPLAICNTGTCRLKHNATLIVANVRSGTPRDRSVLSSVSHFWRRTRRLVYFFDRITGLRYTRAECEGDVDKALILRLSLNHRSCFPVA